MKIISLLLFLLFVAMAVMLTPYLPIPVLGVTHHRTTPSVQATTFPTCDPTLWQHVYHPQRLQVIAPCRTVTGTIYSVAKEADGDVHIRMTPDDPNVVNQVNVSGQKGKLVLEPVCVGTVTQADAKDACARYVSPITIPKVGDRVQVTGSYVLDMQHGGWAELHPVSQLLVLP